MIFFTSDTHWGHYNIIEYCSRPWTTVEEMNEGLIYRWNSVVGPRDTVYHLGDFCMGGKSKPNIWLSRLNGHIHLIRGNHDRYVKDQGFASVQYYRELKVNKQKIVLLHYPMRTWNGSHKNKPSWHLFGHVHGSMTVKHGRKTLDDCLAMDVGVDCCDYYPISIDQVSEIMGLKKLELVERFSEDTDTTGLSNKEIKFRKRMAAM